MHSSGPESRYEYRLLYDNRSERQLQQAALIHAFDAWNQVELVAHAASGPLQLLDRHSQIHTGYSLFEQVVRSLRLLWIVAWLTWVPGIGWIGRRIYPGIPAKR